MDWSEGHKPIQARVSLIRMGLCTAVVPQEEAGEVQNAQDECVLQSDPYILPDKDPPTILMESLYIPGFTTGLLYETSQDVHHAVPGDLDQVLNKALEAAKRLAAMPQTL